jgi:AAA15 family ATPase/GTPase
MVDTNKPVPLNSMGEGMSRVLQLILSVPPAQNGMLLIDEFENGLHYSVQEKVWNLIFDLSVQFNIQVFATTHSWDCIESFAKVAEERPEEGALLRLERSVLPEQEGKIVAIEYNEDELSSMTKANFEVR